MQSLKYLFGGRESGIFFYAGEDEMLCSHELWPKLLHRVTVTPLVRAVEPLNKVA